MATMATTSHGLSVYVNSCIKKPTKTRTNNHAVLTEQSLNRHVLASTDPGPHVAFSNEFYDDDRFGRSLPLRASVEEAESELKDLADEQFYVKLQQLKEANRKTLEECEKLYKEKYEDDDESALGRATAKEMVEQMFAARLAARSGLVSHGSSVTAEQMTNGHHARDGVRDLSSKPPRVPGSKREGSLSKTSPVMGTALPSQSSSLRARHTTAALYSQRPRRSYSLDDDDWRRAMKASPDISDDDAKSDGLLDPDLLASISKIRDMWRGFKIDDYSSAERRHSSASAANRRKKEKQQDLADNWRHRITIPKPFQMSMRESSKTLKKKTKAQLELEEERQEKLRAEEEECQKKFKAQPAPAHIYLPLYDEIREKDESRRRYVKQYCKEMLKSQEKPFNFMKREEEKKQHRVRSATVAEQIARSSQKVKSKEQKFVARPVPDFVLSSDPKEKLLENEEYRKIRIKMRAKELLRESSLPPNMAANQKLKEQREKEKLMKARQKTHTKRRPKSAHKVPDYDFLYREFQKELARRKHAREATVMEPFALETNHLRSSRERVLRDMERDEALMRQTATPRRSLGFLSNSMDSIPCKSTTSADLRNKYLRTSQEREMMMKQQQEEEERRKQIREAKLRRYIMERSDDTPRRVDHGFKERLKRHKEAELSRLEQYEKDLEEMQERVSKRPLLFERESQISAGKAAERKYQSTLKNAGISEDFVRSRGSKSVHIEQDSDEDRDDATFTK